MKVGILYPRSKAYPGMTLDFIDGIKTFLKKQDLTDTLQLFSESVGYAGSEKEVYEKTEKLLILDNVDILVAYIDEKVTGILEPLVQANSKLMLIVNPGANYPENWIAQPNIIHLTLQDAFLCWLCGQQAERQKDNSGLLATDFYDCGYLHVATMVSGYVKSGGGIVYNYINKQTVNEAFNINELTDYLNNETAARTLLCVFDSQPASRFYDSLNNFKGADQLHLSVSPMMLQPPALDKLAHGFKFSINGYQPWMASGETAANADFTGIYFSQTKRHPGLFALLGWETAMILEQVFTTGIDYREGGKIAGILAGATINGPRGEMKLDPQTNYYTAPFVKCSIQCNSNKIETETTAFPMQEWETYIQQPTDGASSGWMNTYLCY